MANSILEYVKDMCYNRLYEESKKFLWKNWRSMDLLSRKVQDVASVNLIDATVQRVYVTDLPGDRIAFDVGFELQIGLSSAGRYRDNDTDCYEWLRFSCEGNLAQGLDDWKITGISVYERRDSLPPNSLSDALVPNILPRDYEQIAHDFLEEYYPEALAIPKSGETPVYVDPKVLAQRLDLQVVRRPISKDSAVFGQIYFYPTDAELYNPQTDRVETVHIPGKTVICDPDKKFLGNCGSLNNTIVHECVHWAKHRKVFMFERLFKEGISNISCEIVGGAKSGIARRSVEQMEQQANRLAPRIQMPAEPFKARAGDLIAEFMRKTGAKHENEVMESVIEQLGVDFMVSRQAAKIRLVELGFEDAVGTFTYVDDHYVPPHSYRKGALERNQTFTLGTQDAAALAITDFNLSQKVNSGAYLFVENHFVLNTPLYLCRDEDGLLELTRYARSHMDECCLVFDMKIKGTITGEYHTECYLNRDRYNYDFQYSFHNGFENCPPEKQRELLKKDMEETERIRRKMTDVPEDCLNVLLDWRNMTKTELADTIEVDEKTIRRIMNESTSQPKLNTVVRICFALNLPPAISEKLLTVFGCPLRLTNQEHLWIHNALHTQYTQPYDAIIEYLEGFGVNI